MMRHGAWFGWSQLTKIASGHRTFAARRPDAVKFGNCGVCSAYAAWNPRAFCAGRSTAGH